MSLLLLTIGIFTILPGIALLMQLRVLRRREQMIASRIVALELVEAPDTADDYGDATPSFISAVLPRRVVTQMARADIGDLKRWPVIALVIVLAAAGVTSLLFGMTAGAAVVGFALGFGWIVLEFIAERRVNAFTESLPPYLDRLRQLLRTGNSPSQAVVRAADDAPHALGRYMAPAIRRIEHGVPIGEALKRVADRLDIIPLYMFATAVETHAQYGGRLTDMLNNLIELMQTRDRVERELKAATSETRMSVSVLIALPLLVAVGLFAFNPTYVSFFWNDPDGQDLAMIMIGLQAVGVLVMRRLSKIKF